MMRKIDEPSTYGNEYVKLMMIDSSNAHDEVNFSRGKQWSGIRISKTELDPTIEIVTDVLDLI